jgi:tRNA (guanosine-2'-O-)-methyltransferase
MAKSLNISVACAISVYEAMRQRKEKGFYGSKNPADPQKQEALLEDYLGRHNNNFSGKEVFRKG